MKNYNIFASKLKLLNWMDNYDCIKVVLVERKKTGKWLAEQLGKSACTISKWGRNTAQPDLRTLYDIANMLDVSINELIVNNK